MFFIDLNKYKNKKQNAINELSQQNLMDQSNEYPYYPKINNYSFIIKNNNSYNNKFYLDINNKSERNIIINLGNKINSENNCILNYNKAIPINNKIKIKLMKQKLLINNNKIKLNKIPKEILRNKLNLNRNVKQYQFKNNNINLINSFDKPNNISKCYKQTQLFLTNNLSKDNSKDKNFFSESISTDNTRNNYNHIPNNQRIFFTNRLKNRNKNSTLKNRIFINKYILQNNEINDKADSFTTKINLNSIHNLTRSQIDSFELNSLTSRNNKSINYNYPLIPSKESNISLNLKKNKKEEKKDSKKKVITRKLNIEELKQLKIFKGLKKGKNICKIPISKTKINKKSIKNMKNKLNLRKKKLIISNVPFVNNNTTNELSKPIAIMQSMSDEKMMEIASLYINNDESVDKILIKDILSTKKSK